MVPNKREAYLITFEDFEAEEEHLMATKMLEWFNDFPQLMIDDSEEDGWYYT